MHLIASNTTLFLINANDKLIVRSVSFINNANTHMAVLLLLYLREQPLQKAQKFIIEKSEFSLSRVVLFYHIISNIISIVWYTHHHFICELKRNWGRRRSREKTIRTNRRQAFSPFPPVSNPQRLLSHGLKIPVAIN